MMSARDSLPSPRLLLAIALLMSPCSLARDLEFSSAPDSVRLAVIGDSGTGGQRQREIADQMSAARQRFAFDTVLMLGDNIYGRKAPADFTKKFERPYSDLLKAAKFYAALGNHDELKERFYPLFNMEGRPHYTIELRPHLRAISLDSSNMNPEQLGWLENQLAQPRDGWTIVFMHHPLYCSGKRHGPSLKLRAILEPLLIKYRVDVVFAGHEHFYERLQPQNGIQYFISGAAAKLRRSNIRPTEETACGFDQDNSFMLLQASGNSLEFRAVARDGNVVDWGTLHKEGGKMSISATCIASR
jgi:hypothetical protein